MRKIILLLKADGDFKHSGKYFLQNGRWHVIGDKHKSAPKGAAIAAHPHAAGKHEAKQHFTQEQWDQLKLPAENVNAKTYNKQIANMQALAESGHVTGILGMQYGTNTYGKKLAIIANNILGAYGVDHKVTPGQKAGEHAAVQHVPEDAGESKPEAPAKAKTEPKAAEKPKPKPENPKAEEGPKEGDTKPAADGGTLVLKDGHWIKQDEPAKTEAPTAEGEAAMPAFVEGKTTTGVVDYYQKQAQKIIDMAAAGDTAGLAAVKSSGLKPNAKGKVSNTWKGKTQNSKMLLALHEQLMQQATEAKAKDAPKAEEPKAPPASTAPASAVSGEIEVPKKLDGLTGDEIDAVKADLKALGIPDPDAKPATSTKLAQIPWDSQLLPDENKNAKSHNKQVGKIKAMAEAGDLAGLEGFKAGSNTYGKKQMKLAQLAAAALKEDAEAAAVAPAAEPKATPTIADQIASAGSVQAAHKAATDYLAEHKTPEGFDETIAALKEHGYTGSVLAFTLMKDELFDGKPAPAALEKPQTDSEHWNGVASEVEHALSMGNMAPIEMVVSTTNGLVSTNAVAVHSYAVAALAKLKAAKKNVDSTTPSLDDIKVANGETAAFEAADKFVASNPTKDGLKQAFNELNDNGFIGAATELKSKHQHLLTAPAGNADAGPKEGDTKQGADGMLVFKNGRWHKVGDDKPAAEEAAAETPAPVVKKLKPSHAISIGKGLKTATGMKAKLKKMAVEGNVEELQAFISTASGGMPASKKYAQLLVAAMTDGQSTGGAAPSSKPKAKAAPVTYSNGVEAMDNWTQTGPQGGSNPGGKFKDENGVEWYCKFPGDENVAKSEILAAKLYAAAGVAGQQAKLITKDGKIGIASKWTDVSKASPSALAGTDGVASGFATDAWLGNWDVVGLAYDNLQVGANGKAVRVDAGGSLEYRAQGGKKAFGNSVIEIDSLRDKSINPQAAAVFGKMTEADITASVAKVLAVSDNTIRTLVELNGPGDAASKKALADTLIARKNDLAAKYPKAVKAKPPKPEFKVENLSKPPTFTDWNGSGKGLSSHQNINEANQAAVDAVYEAAKQGDLAAIKEVQAPVFDKATGDVHSHVALAAHPSQHVKAYWSDMVSEVDLQLNPPRMPEIGEIVASTDMADISALLKPLPAGKSIAAASKHVKAGNYILLGKVADIAPVTPPDNDDVISSQGWKQKAINAYHSATYAAKAVFSTYVTTSGARALNTALRKGNLDSVVAGTSVAEHIENFKGLLVDIPEGSTFVRRMGMSGYGSTPNATAIKELQQFLMAAEPGTVMQEPGFTSTSWTGGNKILANNDIEWEFVAGKGVKMFPAWLTANKGEGEGLLPPNQRYMIVSSKKDGKTVRVKAILLPTID